ncbi:hypothetical protein ACFVYD_10770 [Streptomyces sp. NPDC058301]|uniref:hypothetical protein n=1 Tax=Streptomyces sp. NPDC058301 TaxID=3346436 RepID=UPI0036E7E5D3
MTTAAPRQGKSRRMPVKALALAAALVVLGGAAGTWVLAHDDGGKQPSCATVGGDTRIRKDLAPADTEGMGCTELAAALKRAAASDGSGRHTLAQAKVMRDLLNTLADDFRDRSRVDIAPPLRRPVAQLLAEDATDVHTMLVHYSESMDYLKHAGPAGGPWRDDRGGASACRWRTSRSSW